MTQRILVAGVGNIFLGDDAFGVEVVRRLAGRSLPPGIEVRDFGIRGLDLVYALQEDYAAVILVDVVNRGGSAGMLHVLEIAPESGASEQAEMGQTMASHNLDPARVIELVRALGGRLPRLFLVGCEPATFAPSADLSEPVLAALEPAVERIVALLEVLRQEDGP